MEHPANVEVQIMDDISCIIDEAPRKSSGRSDGNGSHIQHQQVLNRMQVLETQIAACLAAQPLIYQVLGKCNELEAKLKGVQKEMDERIEKMERLDKVIITDPSSNASSEPNQDRTHTRVIEAVEGGGPEFTAADDPDWQPDPDSGGSDNEDDDTEDSQADDADGVEVESEVPEQEFDQTFVCKVCFPKLEFVNAQTLATHYSSVHRDVADTNLETSSSNVNQQPSPSTAGSSRHNLRPKKTCNRQPEDENQMNKCPMCKSIFKTRAHMKQHLASAHTCELCGEEFTRQDKLKAHKSAVHGEKYRRPGPLAPIPCTDGCGVILPHRQALHNHLSVCRRRGLKPYQCDQCGVKYSTNATLRDHNKQMHGEGSGPQKVLCSTCGKSFRKDYIKIHTLTHGSWRRHYCDTCGKGFMVLGKLRIHQRLHTGERPYGCEHCDKAFTSKSNRSKHTLALHTVKPFVCDECGLSFARQYLLRRHKGTHRMGTFNAKTATDAEPAYQHRKIAASEPSV